MSRISVIPPRPGVPEVLRRRGARLVSTTPRQRAELLDGTHWSRRLTWKEEEGIRFFLQLFRLDAGTTLFKEGDSDAFAAIVLDGKLDIIKGDSAERAHVVAKLGRGKLVGEMSLIDGATRSATAVASEQADLLVLSRDDFDRMADDRPDLAFKIAMMIAEAVSQLLRQTTGTLVEHLEPGHSALNSADLDAHAKGAPGEQRPRHPVEDEVE